jgi:hypothetical protein
VHDIPNCRTSHVFRNEPSALGLFGPRERDDGVNGWWFLQGRFAYRIGGVLYKLTHPYVCMAVMSDS